MTDYTQDEIDARDEAYQIAYGAWLSALTLAAIARRGGNEADAIKHDIIAALALADMRDNAAVEA